MLDDDTFPDPSMFDENDLDQEATVKQAVEQMLRVAKENGFLDSQYHELEKLVYSHINIFRTTISAGPPANVPTLKTNLHPKANPTIVNL